MYILGYGKGFVNSTCVPQDSHTIAPHGGDSLFGQTICLAHNKRAGSQKPRLLLRTSYALAE